MTALDHDESQQWLDVAVAAAEAGAEVLRRHFRQADLEIKAKSRHDFVTEADHGSEAAIIETILEAFPDHHILAEESGRIGARTGAIEWVIDPLDGTSNFLHGLPIFCISIAALRAGEPQAAVVLDPLGPNLFTARAGHGAWWNGRKMAISPCERLGDAFLATGFPFRARQALDLYLEVFREVFQASRGVRRCGAAALDLAYTAAGVYDGFFELRLSPWDIAAGVLLVREAGGVITDLDGGADFFRGGNVVAANPAVYAELFATISRLASEAAVDQVDPLVTDTTGGRP